MNITGVVGVGLSCICLLSLVAPFGLILGWSKLVSEYFAETSQAAWVVSFVILLALMGLAFVVSYAVRNATLGNDDLMALYIQIFLHPGWWLLGLTGLLNYVLLPKGRAVLRKVLLFAATLYVVTLATSPLLTRANFLSTESNDLHLMVWYFGFFAYLFFSVTFLFVTLYSPSKKLTAVALIGDFVLTLATTAAFVFVLLKLTD